LEEGLERVVESGARALADQFHDELADLVTGTIARWDAAETSGQLELLLGPDLQYIRLNGTIVAASVGLAFHPTALVLPCRWPRAGPGAWGRGGPARSGYVGPVGCPVSPAGALPVSGTAHAGLPGQRRRPGPPGTGRPARNLPTSRPARH